MNWAKDCLKLFRRFSLGITALPVVILALAIAGPLARDAFGVVSQGGKFVRGDSNGDGKVDISDPIFTIRYLYLGGPTTVCLAAADANDDERVDISDPIVLLQHLFVTGRPLPPPGPDPGLDPTPGMECGS